jgi:hypothetical protein
MSYTLNITFLAGTDFDKSIEEAYALTKIIKGSIEYKFNGLRVFVCQNGSVITTNTENENTRYFTVATIPDKMPY